MPKSTVTVRMYDVGFGDCFLITVAQGDNAWRMLVDCGVHALGKARPLRDVVRAVIADLTVAAGPGAQPALDVVVATHHHADHITGFAYDDWEQVQVGEVWLSFVEDQADADAKTLREGLAHAANSLATLVDRAGASPADAGSSAALGLAGALAMNSLGNADAMDRLLGANGKQFANTPAVRYLPSRLAVQNVIQTTLPGVIVHVLGPSRDPDQLKRMNPPSSARWLAMQQGLDDERNTLTAPAAPEAGAVAPIFTAGYAVTAAEVADEIGPGLAGARQSLRLADLLDDSGELLAASSILERSVNNTSIYFVLDVAGTRLVFVGDSQQGAWEHVLDDPAARSLVSNPVFYKIGHHGSHNATPRDYVSTVIGTTGTYAMLPYGKVQQWGDIPKQSLLTALAATKTRIVRADAPLKSARVRVGPAKLWSEVSFTAD